MRSFRFWVLLMTVVVAVFFLAFSLSGEGNIQIGEGLHGQQGNIQMVSSHSRRKLKVNNVNDVDSIINNNNKWDSSTVGMEDYPQYDPDPSSKASVKPGPIEHGSPLMPYIPVPTPPGEPPKRDGVP